MRLLTVPARSGRVHRVGPRCNYPVPRAGRQAQQRL